MAVDTVRSMPPMQSANLAVADAQASPDLTTPEGVAAAGGYETVWFGRVMAVAPSTMTVLNTDPSLSQLPIERLAAIDPLPFLLGSLTPEQFTLLATSGIGMADLTPDQQTLFEAMMPQPLQVVSSDAPDPQYAQFSPGTDVSQQINDDQIAYDQEIINVPSDYVFDNVRLHAYLNENYSLDAGAGSSCEITTHAPGDFSSGDKKLTSHETVDGSSENAASPDLASLLVTSQPNTPKPVDIDWRLSALSALVPIDGIVTINDLIERLNKATNLELYADPRYGTEKLFIAGDLSTKHPAVDLMQALALCVCGTWRKVGPTAYILTNDLAGLGMRQQFLSDVVQTWTNRLTTAGALVGARLVALGWMRNLYPYVGDFTDIPKDQLLALCGDADQGTLKWSDLPQPTQDALMQQMADRSGGDLASDTDAAIGKPAASIKPDTEVDVSVDMQMALELPDTGIMSFGEFKVDQSAVHPFEFPPSSQKVALPEKIRGVICAPKTGEEARKVVDMLPGLGLNALFIDVFNNGRTYFANSAILPETDEAASVLASAIDEASRKNIAVFAVLDTLCWRKDGNAPRPSVWPSQFAEDVNIFGETSEEGARRRIAQNVIQSADPFDAESLSEGPVSEGWVSPLDPTVRAALPVLVKDLAEVPGLAGLVFQDTAVPGYCGAADCPYGKLDLGYTSDNRLSYVRATHRDPVDLGNNAAAVLSLPNGGGPPVQFSLEIPEFANVFGSDSTDPWTAYRTNADVSLLGDCFNSARSANSRLSLLMRERELGLTIDPWIHAKDVNQVSDESDLSLYDYVNRNSIVVIDPVPVLRTSPGSFTSMTESMRDFVSRARAGGIVFDLVSGGIDDYVPTLLQQMSPYLAPSK